MRGKLFGLIVLNFSDADDNTERPQMAQALKDLTDATPWVTIDVHVRPGQLPLLDAFDHIRRHGQHLGEITFRCTDGATEAAWNRAWTVTGCCGDVETQ